MLTKVDKLLERELDKLANVEKHGPDYIEEYEAINKLGGLRVALFRELIDVALAGATARSVTNAYDETDYKKWLDLVDKGAEDQQGPASRKEDE